MIIKNERKAYGTDLTDSQWEIVKECFPVTGNKSKWEKRELLNAVLYLASKKIVEHWTVSCRNWDMVLNQLNIMFAERISA